jgi:hypothetical protein
MFYLFPYKFLVDKGVDYLKAFFQFPLSDAFYNKVRSFYEKK